MSMKCEWCGTNTQSHTGLCQTCKSRRFHTHRRIEKEHLLVDQAGGSWWIWTAMGEVLVGGRKTKGDAIRALALDEMFDDSDGDEAGA